MTSTTLLRTVLLAAATSLAVAGGQARGAETDPIYPWLHPPKDATAALDRAINRRLAVGLDDLNRRFDRRTLACSEAALDIVQPLASTAQWFFLGDTRNWGMDMSPRTRTEYDEVFRRESVYRDATLFPFGSFVPFDPGVLVGDVLFGTDKLGHFFTNGARAYRRFVDARAGGVDEHEALLQTIDLGMGEEGGWLGAGVSGIYSYADLEANDAGLRYLRSLCEGPTPGLIFDHDVDRWALRAPFRLAPWVTPCWDEAFRPSAFLGSGDGVVIHDAIARECKRLVRPEAVRRRARYRELGCTSSFARLGDQRGHELIQMDIMNRAIGEVLDPNTQLRDVVRARGGPERAPDPAYWDVATICGLSPAPAPPADPPADRR